MAEKNVNDYTVCILLGPEMDSVLLVRKNRTSFRGMLNGPGGAVEDGENPYDGALREIREETGLEPEDLKSLGFVRLAKLGELLVPLDCKKNDGSACRLHYYAGAVKAAALAKIRPAEEQLCWRPYWDVAGSGTDSREYAGHGDLAYFAAAGRRELMERLPDAAGTDGRADGAQDLVNAMNAARGRLDASFRKNDLFQASLDAADVSKLAYAAFCLKMPASRDSIDKSDKGGEAHAAPGVCNGNPPIRTDKIV